MQRAYHLLILSFVLLFPSVASADKLVLVAGGGSKAGDCPATEAKLIGPFGVDFDRSGNMYIVEMTGNRVHKVDAKGMLTTIAGTGMKGDKGDDGPAVKAEFNGMHSCCMLPDGNLCLADTFNSRLRKLDLKSGIVTALAGTGKKAFSGDGGPALKAEFTGLYSVVVDAKGQNLIVADLENRRVRKIDRATGSVTTIAGNGQKGIPTDGAAAEAAPLVDPRAVAADKSGNVWILERGGHALRVVDVKGRIRTVAGTGKAGPAGGGGDALKATFNSPKHLCMDVDGNVVIADSGNHCIRKFIVAEGTIVPVAGSGKKGAAGLEGDALQAEMNEPHGVTVNPSGVLYIIDSNNDRVLKLAK
jgi:DNA-binding beta-propeller fold protein YncE